MATSVVGNVLRRTTMARSPAWTRGGSLGHAQRRARETEKRGERGGGGRLSFERRRGEPGEGEPGVDATWRAGMGRREGGGHGMGQHERCGNGRQRPGRDARGRRGVATSLNRPNRRGGRG
jgi:hypothetical protein